MMTVVFVAIVDKQGVWELLLLLYSELNYIKISFLCAANKDWIAELGV